MWTVRENNSFWKCIPINPKGEQGQSSIKVNRDTLPSAGVSSIRRKSGFSKETFILFHVFCRGGDDLRIV